MIKPQHLRIACRITTLLSLSFSMSIVVNCILFLLSACTFRTSNVLVIYIAVRHILKLMSLINSIMKPRKADKWGIKLVFLSWIYKAAWSSCSICSMALVRSYKRDKVSNIRVLTYFPLVIFVECLDLAVLKKSEQQAIFSSWMLWVRVFNGCWW